MQYIESATGLPASLYAIRTVHPLGTWAAGEGVAVQVAYGTFTVSWPVAITWLTPSGLAPDPSKYAGKTLVIALYKIGSTIFGVGGQ